jgi:hypothetical protein
MLQTAELRTLGEQTPRLEHRHGDRWKRMDRTIPMLTDRYPKSYRGDMEMPDMWAGCSSRVAGADGRALRKWPRRSRSWGPCPGPPRYPVRNDRANGLRGPLTLGARHVRQRVRGFRPLALPGPLTGCRLQHVGGYAARQRPCDAVEHRR